MQPERWLDASHGRADRTCVFEGLGISVPRRRLGWVMDALSVLGASIERGFGRL